MLVAEREGVKKNELLVAQFQRVAVAEEAPFIRFQPLVINQASISRIDVLNLVAVILPRYSTMSPADRRRIKHKVATSQPANNRFRAIQDYLQARASALDDN